MPASVRRSPLLPLGAACLFASGFGSLALEVVWSRSLELVFGSTTLAVSTVLVAYMLGLGLGGLAGGRLASRFRSAARAYGIIEIAVALYAMCVPLLFELFPWLNRVVLHPMSFWPAAFLRFLLVLVFLIVPTVLMGATLPVLAHGLVRTVASIGDRVGLLYGLNTLGAVAGTVSATWWLFPTLGLWGTNFAGAGADLLVGIFALTVLTRLERREAHVTARPAETPAASKPRPRYDARQWVLLLSYGVVGLTGLTYEVAWTRALTMVFGSSVYAFSTMLAAFLAGIALGSLLARRWVDRLRDPVTAYAAGLALVGLSALMTVPLMGNMPWLFLKIIEWFGLSGRALLLANVTLSLTTMIVPTLLLGALFPLLVRAIALDEGAIAVRVGDVYFANTVGSALGAFVAGFLLIPALGLRLTISSAVALNLVAAAVTLSVSSWQPVRWRRVAGLACMGAAVAVLLNPPGWNREMLDQGVYQRPWRHIDVDLPMVPMPEIDEDEVLFYEEGLNTTVSVHRTPDGLDMRVNGKTDASEQDMPTQVLSGHLPILFGGHAGEIAVIGYASGITSGAVTLHDPRHVDVIEIEPAVIQGSRFFEPLNHRPLARSNVDLIMDDGRNFLSGTKKHYDVIISEPSNPWLSGCSNLFTKEFFEIARSRLKPGGRLLQWIQLYGMNEAALRSVLRSLSTTFPHVYGFLYSADHPDLLLLASDRPVRCEDLPRWDRLSPAVREDLMRVGIHSTAELWSLVAITPDEIAQLAAEAEVMNTDNSMYVELTAPLHVYEGGARNLELLHETARGVLPLLSDAATCASAELVGETAISYLDDRRHRGLSLLVGRHAHRMGDQIHPPLIQLLLSARSGRIDLSTAISRAEAIARRSPAAFEVRLQCARLHEQARSWRPVVHHAAAALTLRPDHLPAQALRMRGLAATGRLSQAYDIARELIETPLREIDLRLLADTGVLADAAGDHEAAIGYLEQYLRRRPFSPRQWGMLALARKNAGRFQEAALARDQQRLARQNIARLMEREALLASRMGRDEAAERIREDLARMFPERSELAERSRGASTPAE